jgi:helicase MOV-10
MIRYVFLSQPSCSRALHSFSVSLGGSARSLRYRQDTCLVVSFNSNFQSLYENRLEITFEDLTLRTRFIIVRAIRAIVSDPELYASLQPSTPYVPRSRATREVEVEVVPGVKPDSLKIIPWAIDLPHALIPKSMARALTGGTTRDAVVRARRTYLPAIFDSATYGRHFKTLLWIEELRME